MMFSFQLRCPTWRTGRWQTVERRGARFRPQGGLPRGPEQAEEERGQSQGHVLLERQRNQVRRGWRLQVQGGLQERTHKNRPHQPQRYW